MGAQFPPTKRTYLEQFGKRWLAAEHGSKGAVCEEAATYLGASPETVRGWFKTVLGIETGRKRRSDAGQCGASVEDLLRIAAALMGTFRKTGNRIMTAEDGVYMLKCNGTISTELSVSRLLVLLRKNGLHPDQLSRERPAIQQRSLYPNHVWQVDASVCVAYYLSNAQGLCVMDERAFYKNKPANISRIQKERLIRYTVVDHYSNIILTWYCLGSECTAHLAEFLIFAFSDKGAAHVMHGVPSIVQLDMGAANTSAPVKNFLERMQVQLIVHERHNSRANGAVEKAHHLVEIHFESALRFAHIKDLNDLNEKALAWAHHYSVSKKLGRVGVPRASLYLAEMRPEYLRKAPSVEVMREAVTSHPVTRKVSTNLEIRFAITGLGQFTYDVRNLPGVIGGETVEVAVNPLRRPCVVVGYVDAETGTKCWMQFEPIVRGADGRREDAPVINEQHRAAPRGLLERNRDAILMLSYGSDTVTTPKEAALAQEKGALVFGGRVDPFKRVAEANLPVHIPRQGTPLELGDRQPVKTAPMPHEKAAFAIKRVVGRAYPTATMLAALKAEFPDGVPENQIQMICDRVLSAAAAGAPEATHRRAVGDWS